MSQSLSMSHIAFVSQWLVEDLSIGSPAAAAGVVAPRVPSGPCAQEGGSRSSSSVSAVHSSVHKVHDKVGRCQALAVTHGFKWRLHRDQMSPPLQPGPMGERRAVLTEHEANGGNPRRYGTHEEGCTNHSSIRPGCGSPPSLAAAPLPPAGVAQRKHVHRAHATMLQRAGGYQKVATV
jgi:hypothetical protein